MKIITLGHDAITIELDPADCFLLAEACRAAVNFDAATSLALTSTMEATMTLAGLAASTHDSFSGCQGLPLAEVRQLWMPCDDRAVH